MPLEFKSGDSVTLSASVPVALTQYDRLKAHATITRVLGDDIETDLAEMEFLLKQLLYRSVQVQLDPMEAMIAALDEGGVDALKEMCCREVDASFTPHVAPKKRAAGRRVARKKS